MSDTQIASVGHPLPSWVEETLPKQVPPATIYWNDKFHRVAVKNHPAGYFSTVVEAYKYLSQYNLDINFDPSVDGRGGKIKHDSFWRETGRGTIQRLSGMKNTRRRERLVRTYQEFLNEVDTAYRNDPNNWALAYEWLDRHPAFWTRNSTEEPFFWNTDQGLKNSHNVIYSRHNPVVIIIEHGASSGPDYTQNFLDFKLTAQGRTFEDAYVALAKLVDQFYHTDGTEREGVEYEKSEIELQLEGMLKV